MRSLASLVGCAEALKEAMGEQYSKGIKAGMKAQENAKLDYKNTNTGGRPRPLMIGSEEVRQRVEIC